MTKTLSYFGFLGKHCLLKQNFSCGNDKILTTSIMGYFRSDISIVASYLQIIDFLEKKRYNEFCFRTITLRLTCFGCLQMYTQQKCCCFCLVCNIPPIDDLC